MVADSTPSSAAHPQASSGVSHTLGNIRNLTFYLLLVFSRRDVVSLPSSRFHNGRALMGISSEEGDKKGSIWQWFLWDNSP